MKEPKLTKAQVTTVQMIYQGLTSSKVGLINKRTANSLIKKGVIRMAKNGIDYEVIQEYTDFPDEYLIAKKKLFASELTTSYKHGSQFHTMFVIRYINSVEEIIRKFVRQFPAP